MREATGFHAELVLRLPHRFRPVSTDQVQQTADRTRTHSAMEPPGVRAVPGVVVVLTHALRTHEWAIVIRAPRLKQLLIREVGRIHDHLPGPGVEPNRVGRQRMMELQSLQIRRDLTALQRRPSEGIHKAHGGRLYVVVADVKDDAERHERKDLDKGRGEGHNYFGEAILDDPDAARSVVINLVGKVLQFARYLAVHDGRICVHGSAHYAGGQVQEEFLVVLEVEAPDRLGLVELSARRIREDPAVQF